MKLRTSPTAALAVAALLLACVPDGDAGTSGDPGGSSSDTTVGAPTGGTTGATPTSGPTSTGDTPTSVGTTGDTGVDDTTGGPTEPTACTALWDTLADRYPDAGDVADCGDDPVAASLMRLAGLAIDNNGATMYPCVEARCSAEFVYVASNSLPHYDFVQTTPNPLVEQLVVHRVPRQPAPYDDDPGGAEPAAAIAGCEDAYAQYLDNPDQATTREPSQLCIAAATDKQYFYDDLETGRVFYKKIECLGQTGFMINGDPIYGPNEAATPDPWGNPGYNFPSDPNDEGSGATLDLCGGHTANQMHYHAAIAACFERDGDGRPQHSYVEATADWDLASALDGSCSAESPVVGWSPDGYPIKGPCVCVARDEQGECTDLKWARSAWVYAGLGAWGEDPGEAAALDVEGMPCSADSECCAGNGCNFQCSYSVFDDAKAPGGSVVDRRCVLLDYSWCGHRFIDRSGAGDTGTFAYLDRCNGFTGPDGFAYHTTLSFPYLPACYHGAPAAQAEQEMMGMGGMNPPKCDMVPPGMPCCGDDLCGGPETAANCPEDCG